MADAGGEKTEQPTAKKLRDAREKGDIPKSTEVVSVLVVGAVCGYFIASATSLYESLVDITSQVFIKASRLSYDEALRELLPLLINSMVAFILPLVLIIVVCVVLGFVVQNGFVIAPQAAIPKIENLHPKKWFEKVFSKKNLFDFMMNLVKVTVLSGAVFLAIHNSMRAILRLGGTDIFALLSVAGAIIRDLFIYTIVAFMIIALFDWFYTRIAYTKKHMMSMDEVKREFKEQEGDPHIKAKRKQLHQEMSNQSKLDRVRKAKVLVVNPTHYAVALDYDKDTCPLPVMLAKGEGNLALRMIEIAQQENIPIMRNAPLARSLYANGHEEEVIPADLLMQVAEILRIVMSLNAPH